MNTVLPDLPLSVPLQHSLKSSLYRAIFLLLLSLMICGPSNTAKAQPFLGSSDRLQTRPETPLAQRITPGTLLRIKLDYPSDVNGFYRVSSKGTIELPLRLTRSVRVKDKTVAEATEMIDQVIEPERSTNVEVSIIELGQDNSITLMGEVIAPGRYSYEPFFMLTDAIMIAGGPKKNARGNNSYIIRASENPTGRARLVPFNVAALFKYGAKDIKLHPGDVIVIDPLVSQE